MKLTLEEYEQYLKEKSVSYELLIFNHPVKSVKDASESANGNGRIIKTLVITNGNDFVAVILPGEKMLDFSKFPGYTMATPGEVRERTGFPPGGVPPIIPEFRTILDKSLLSDEWLVGGGGRENILMKVRTSDIIRASSPEIIDL